LAGLTFGRAVFPLLALAFAALAFADLAFAALAFADLAFAALAFAALAFAALAFAARVFAALAFDLFLGFLVIAGVFFAFPDQLFLGRPNLSPSCRLHREVCQT
jgi:hypothetical protein